jgi:hypothetical protein
MWGEGTGRRVDQVGAPERVSRACPWHSEREPAGAGSASAFLFAESQHCHSLDFEWLLGRGLPYQPQRYREARNGGERGKERRRVWGDISDTAPHAGLAGTPRPGAILHTLWVNKMSAAWMTPLAPCLASDTAVPFMSSGPAPGTPIPCLLVHHRGHLGLVGKLLCKNLLSVSAPVLLRAEIDASAHKRIGVQVHRLAVYYLSDKFVRRQAFHRREALRRIGNFDLKSGGGEQVLLLLGLLLRADAARDTEDKTGDCPTKDQLDHPRSPAKKPSRRS